MRGLLGGVVIHFEVFILSDLLLSLEYFFLIIAINFRLFIFIASNLFFGHLLPDQFKILVIATWLDSR